MSEEYEDEIKAATTLVSILRRAPDRAKELGTVRDLEYSRNIANAALNFYLEGLRPEVRTKVTDSLLSSDSITVVSKYSFKW